MIYINKNSINDVVLTLRENSNLWNYSGITPYYLFEFTSDNSNRSIYFTPTNISPLSAQQRYDEFYIVESGATFVNYSAATINMAPAIFWNYNIYEQLTQYNLNPLNTFGTVEVGKVFVSGYTGYQATTYDYSGSTIYTTYQIPQ